MIPANAGAGRSEMATAREVDQPTTRDTQADGQKVGQALNCAENPQCAAVLGGGANGISRLLALLFHWPLSGRMWK